MSLSRHHLAQRDRHLKLYYLLGIHGTFSPQISKPCHIDSLQLLSRIPIGLGGKSGAKALTSVCKFPISQVRVPSESTQPSPRHPQVLVMP